ncbi:hypothetical protein LJ739_04585 [Aestuariibacter halophilus]|uniref:Histone H1 n=1 Tax=Fluctibacter halophilus TaxID=226011 RepID=A0ABS8G4S4_9ALTE|nr:hypothetical protein [Aestuariibacter halophilus]MCC2615514.1 hypothetical protein [Aestuariibacter halophilus]
MSKLDKDQVIAKFTEAYKAANGKAPNIEAKGGWYSVDGGKNIRLAALDEMADELASGSKPAKAAAKKPAAEKAAPKKADAKKADSKKAAPKKPAAKAKKPAKGGFSVKAYWAEQVADGSRPPR